MDLLYDGLKLGRTVGPLLQQLHGLVEVLHVLAIHFEEGCEFLQDVSDARRRRPGGKRENSRWLQVVQSGLNPNCQKIFNEVSIMRNINERVYFNKEHWITRYIQQLWV